jgi:20S proteasome alpha/beta subunit
MTLIIGIKCSDGIVMGADGAATYAALGQSTIRQETKKLEIFENCVIVGVAGPIGLGQRIRAEIQALWVDGEVKLQDQKSAEVMRIIRGVIWNKHIGPEMQVAHIAASVIGPQLAQQSAIASTVVGLPLQESSSLIQFDHQGAPEEASATLPFVAIGSGQPIADPFLAFLRRLFWPDRLPTLNDGIFSTLWTLQHAIQTNPGGVSGPKQIMILEKKNNVWKARELQEAELYEHEEAIQAHEKQLIDFHKLVPGAENEKNPLLVPLPS